MSFERFLNERLPDALRDPPPDADPEVVKAARQYHRGKAAHDYLIGEAQARARYAALPEVVSPQLRDAASRALSTMAAANVHMDGTFESILNSAASGAWPAASGTKPITNALKAAEQALNERRLAEQQRDAAEHDKPIITVPVSFSAKGMRFPAGTYAIEHEQLAELETWRQGMEAQRQAAGWDDLTSLGFNQWPPFRIETAQPVGAQSP